MPSQARSPARTTLLLLLSLVLAVHPVGAQVVRGFVHEATGAPVAGALVTLVDSAGHEYGRGITAMSGSFTLSGAPGGTRQVQVARIGFRAWSSRPFSGEAGDTVQLRLVVEDLLVRLPEITAVADRCESLATATDRVAVLWEEARKAITLADLSYRGEPFSYRLDRRTSRSSADEALLSDTIVTASMRARWPVEALPAGALLTRGFVQRDLLDAPVYYGPDLSVLYAPAFLETHCLAALTGDSGTNLVGVSYRPAQQRPLSDVEGALWLDAATLQLRSLAFRYTGLGRWVPRASSGGELSFLRLGDGRWVIDHWRMQAPIPLVRGRDTSLFGFAALEAVVIAVTAPSGATLWQGAGFARPGTLAADGWTGPLRALGAEKLPPSPIDLDDAAIRGTRGRLVSARNRSDHPVRITGLALYACVNVQERCVVTDTSLLLPPHEKRPLLEVHPWFDARPPRYQVAYRWEPE